MVNSEFIVRVLVLLAVAALISRLYWRLVARFLKLFKLKFPRLALGLLSAFLGIATLFGLFFIYVYHGFGYQPDIYRVGNRSSNKVAITFDDGPSREFTPAILDILKEHNAPATFFMVGSHVEKNPDIAQRIVEDGHIVGNHTQSHKNIPILSTIELQKEMMEATAIITETTGVY